MSTSAVRNADLLLSNPYHQPVNSRLKRSRDFFSIHTNQCQRNSQLGSQQVFGWLKEISELYFHRIWVFKMSGSNSLNEGKQGLFPTSNLEITLIDKLKFFLCPKQAIIQMCTCVWWDKITEPQGVRGSSISLSQRLHVHKSLRVKLVKFEESRTHKQRVPLGSSEHVNPPSHSTHSHQSWQSLALNCVCACRVQVCWSLPACVLIWCAWSLMSLWSQRQLLKPALLFALFLSRVQFLAMTGTDWCLSLPFLAWQHVDAESEKNTKWNTVQLIKRGVRCQSFFRLWRNPLKAC